MVTIQFLDYRSLSRCQASDFNPTHPERDPATVLATSFKAYMHRPIFFRNLPSSLPVENLQQARRYSHAHKWSVAHAAELTQLNVQGAVEWVSMLLLQKEYKTVATIMIGKYKLDVDDNINDQKARRFVPGSLTKSNTNYDPNEKNCICSWPSFNPVDIFTDSSTRKKYWPLWYHIHFHIGNLWRWKSVIRKLNADVWRVSASSIKTI